MAKFGAGGYGGFDPLIHECELVGLKEDVGEFCPAGEGAGGFFGAVELFLGGKDGAVGGGEDGAPLEGV